MCPYATYQRGGDASGVSGCHDNPRNRPKNLPNTPEHQGERAETRDEENSSKMVPDLTNHLDGGTYIELEGHEGVEAS